MYPKGLYINLDLLFYNFSMVLAKKWNLVTDSFHFWSFFVIFSCFWQKIWALIGLPCGPMYPKGLYMNLDFLFHYFTKVLARKWSLVMDYFHFWSFLVIFSWFLA